MSNRCIGDYIVTEKIGSGSFAQVYKAHHKATKQTVAVKAISRERLNDKLQENLESEIAILRAFKHRHITQLFEIKKTQRHIYLLLEFCGGGDLHRLIRKQGPLSAHGCRNFMRQLTSGLHFLWGRQLIHRDLKPQNLLLSAANEGATLKIADFGFARHLETASLAETLCGSPLYMAPEILRFQRYGAEADLWSTGTIMYEMAAGRPPYSGANHIHLLANIDRTRLVLSDSVVRTVGEDGKALLLELLQRDPRARMRFEVFFRHRYLQGWEQFQDEHEGDPGNANMLQRAKEGVAGGERHGPNEIEHVAGVAAGVATPPAPPAPMHGAGLAASAHRPDASQHEQQLADATPSERPRRHTMGGELDAQAHFGIGPPAVSVSVPVDEQQQLLQKQPATPPMSMRNIQQTGYHAQHGSPRANEHQLRQQQQQQPQIQPQPAWHQHQGARQLMLASHTGSPRAPPAEMAQAQQAHRRASIASPGGDQEACRRRCTSDPPPVGHQFGNAPGTGHGLYHGAHGLGAGAVAPYAYDPQDRNPLRRVQGIGMHEQQVQMGVGVVDSQGSDDFVIVDEFGGSRSGGRPTSFAQTHAATDGGAEVGVDGDDIIVAECRQLGSQAHAVAEFGDATARQALAASHACARRAEAVAGLGNWGDLSSEVAAMSASAAGSSGLSSASASVSDSAVMSPIVENREAHGVHVATKAKGAAASGGNYVDTPTRKDGQSAHASDVADSCAGAGSNTDVDSNATTNNSSETQDNADASKSKGTTSMSASRLGSGSGSGTRLRSGSGSGLRSRSGSGSGSGSGSSSAASLHSGEICKAAHFMHAQALALYLKALWVFDRAIQQAKAALAQVPQRQAAPMTQPTSLHDVLRWLQEQFSACLERAQQCKAQLPESGEGGDGTIDMANVDANELMYKRALQLGRAAAGKELLGQRDSGLEQYQHALLLFETIAMDRKCQNASDLAQLKKFIGNLRSRISHLSALSQATVTSPEL